jgi:chemotaxis signal transduction protein
MHASHPARLRLAHARIGAVHLGIPAASVVQAIPVPDTLALLPLRGKALRGVIEHGGALVPVVDLARWVEVGSAAPEPGDAARILILREAGRTIGLQVDALGGLVDAAAQQAVRLHHDDNPEDVFHSALQAPDGGPILNLLEVGRLANLALAWSQASAAGALRGCETAAGPRAAGAADSAGAGGASLYALLDTGQGVLGVQPAELAEVLPMPALQQLGAGGGAYCTWRGRHLAVLPCAALMGTEDQAGEGGAPLLAVFAHTGLALGVPVRAVLQLRSLGPGLATPDGVTATVFDADGAEIRLLDTARLFAGYPEAALSRPATPAAPAAGGPDNASHGASAGKGRAANGCAYIVFEADGVQAVPIGSVEHIAPLAQGATATMATMAWHGEAIRLVDLRTRGAAHGHVLVTHGPQGHVGYVVTRVHSLIPAGAGQMYRMGSGRGTGGPVDFITVGEGAGQASYRIVELEAAQAA